MLIDFAKASDLSKSLSITTFEVLRAKPKKALNRDFHY